MRGIERTAYTEKRLFIGLSPARETSISLAEQQGGRKGAFAPVRKAATNEAKTVRLALKNEGRRDAAFVKQKGAARIRA